VIAHIWQAVVKFFTACSRTPRCPSIAFAEWGPDDMAFSLGIRRGTGPMPQPLQAARAKIFATTKADKLFSELSSRTYWTFAREFSPFKAARGDR
jgi:hypothetical protein